MKIDILTLFPAMFHGPFRESIVGRAQKNSQVEIEVHDLRDWTSDQHRTVDDRPYGGGPGMVMMIEPIDKALKELRLKSTATRTQVVLLSARGNTYTQQKAQVYASYDHLILLCGHYEGVDQRVADNLCDEELSIGDYVLTGGELPAMIVVDSIVRLLPGVIGAAESLIEESHATAGYIEYPQYTRPENYHDMVVPEVLLSGNHTKIKDWRNSQSRNK